MVCGEVFGFDGEVCSEVELSGFVGVVGEVQSFPLVSTSLIMFRRG